MSLSLLHFPLASLAVLFCLAPVALAEDAADTIILTITGPSGASEAVVFDRDDLMAMRQVTYQTTTIWTNGLLEFRGVPLSEILKVAKLTGTSLRLTASNDYAAEVPVESILPDVPILAFEIDGKPMSLRDKGPLWLVYPYDLSTAYQTEVVYTRSIWQLERIEVLP